MSYFILFILLEGVVFVKSTIASSEYTTCYIMQLIFVWNTKLSKCNVHSCNLVGNGDRKCQIINKSLVNCGCTI